jgi:hypothetical protein
VTKTLDIGNRQVRFIGTDPALHYLVGETAIASVIDVNAKTVELQFDDRTILPCAYGWHKFSVLDIEFVHEEDSIFKDMIDTLKRECRADKN